MTYTPDLQEFYRRSLQPELASLEGSRQLAVAPALVFRAGTTLLFLCITSILAAVALGMPANRGDLFALGLRGFMSFVIALCDIGIAWYLAGLTQRLDRRIATAAIAVLAAAVQLLLAGLLVERYRLLKDPTTSLLVAVLGGLFIYIPVLIVCAALENRFVRRFKNQVWGRLVSYMIPDARYEANGAIAESHFNDSGFFASTRHRYSGSDRLQGRFGKAEVELSQLRVRTRGNSSSSGGSGTAGGGAGGTTGSSNSSTLVFRGLFCRAMKGSGIGGQLVLIPNTIPHRVLRRLDSALGGKLRALKTGDRKFDEAFLVATTSEGAALSFLDEDRRADILDFRERWHGHDVYLGWKDREEFIAIDLDRDLFAPPVFSPLTDFGIVERLHDALLTVFEFAEE